MIFLAHSSKQLESESDFSSTLACRSCRNKTYLLRYFNGAAFPRLTCACCGSDGGLVGWATDSEPET